MRDEHIAGLPFLSFGWGQNVRIHLHKAFAAKPGNVDELESVLTRIFDAGPYLDGCHHLIPASTCIRTDENRRWFGVVPVRKLVALARWDHHCLFCLSVIDLDRLVQRPNRQKCVIVDREFGSDGRRIAFELFVDPHNHIVCVSEGKQMFDYDPWNNRQFGDREPPAVPFDLDPRP